MRVVVTGGAGFIGSNVCQELKDNDIHPIILDNLGTGYKENVQSGTIHLGSIERIGWLQEKCKDADAIIHLAALPSVPRSIKDPLATHRNNTDGTMNVLEVARRLEKHVILASSSSVYGDIEVQKHEDLMLRPRSPYAATKVANEAYAMAYADSFGVRTLTFRFFNVYGPNQRNHDYAAVIPRFIGQALEDKPLTIYGNGDQRRDFTYVGDVAKTIVDAIKRTVYFTRPINLAFGQSKSIVDVADRLETILGVELDREYGPKRVGDVFDSEANPYLFTSIFPTIKPTDFYEGLEKTVEWFKKDRRDNGAS